MIIIELISGILFFIGVFVVFKSTYKNYSNDVLNLFKLLIKNKKIKITTSEYLEKIIDGSTYYIPVLSFKLKENETYIVKTEIGLYSNKERKFTIIYNPDDPSKNAVFDIFSIIVIPLFYLSIILGLILTLKYLLKL